MCNCLFMCDCLPLSPDCERHDKKFYLAYCYNARVQNGVSHVMRVQSMPVEEINDCHHSFQKSSLWSMQGRCSLPHNISGQMSLNFPKVAEPKSGRART